MQHARQAIVRRELRDRTTHREALVYVQIHRARVTGDLRIDITLPAQAPRPVDPSIHDDAV